MCRIDSNGEASRSRREPLSRRIKRLRTLLTSTFCPFFPSVRLASLAERQSAAKLVDTFEWISSPFPSPSPLGRPFLVVFFSDPSRGGSLASRPLDGRTAPVPPRSDGKTAAELGKYAAAATLPVKLTLPDGVIRHEAARNRRGGGDNAAGVYRGKQVNSNGPRGL